MSKNLSNTANQCIQKTAIAVIVNPLKELSQIDWSFAKDKTVIDCWRCLSPGQIRQIGYPIPLWDRGGIKTKNPARGSSTKEIGDLDKLNPLISIVIPTKKFTASNETTVHRNDRSGMGHSRSYRFVAPPIPRPLRRYHPA